MGSPDDPLSLNRYVYCGLDPVNNVDPTGFNAEALQWGLRIAGGAGATIAMLTGVGEAAIGVALIAAGTYMLADAISDVIDANKGSMTEARKQVFKHYPTRKDAKDAADAVGRYQKDGKTQGSEKHKKGDSHFHDKNHNDESKPNVHYGYPD